MHKNILYTSISLSVCGCSGVGYYLSSEYTPINTPASGKMNKQANKLASAKIKLASAKIKQSPTTTKKISWGKKEAEKAENGVDLREHKVAFYCFDASTEQNVWFELPMRHKNNNTRDKNDFKRAFNGWSNIAKHWFYEKDEEWKVKNCNTHQQNIDLIKQKEEPTTLSEYVAFALTNKTINPKDVVETVVKKEDNSWAQWYEADVVGEVPPWDWTNHQGKKYGKWVVFQKKGVSHSFKYLVLWVPYDQIKSVTFNKNTPPDLHT